MTELPPIPLADIRALIAAGRQREVMTLLEAWPAGDPDGLEALRCLADCQILEGLPDQAITSLQFSLLFDPDHRPSRVSLARLLWQNDQLPQALSLLPELLLEEPSNLEEALLLVRILYDGEQFELALEVCERLLLNHGDAAEAWFAQAMVLQCLGRYAEAITAYGRALELQEDWHQAAVNRGLLRLLAGDALGGGEDYERRWLLGELTESPLVALPRWDGRPCSGTVLLWAEQGLGDELFWLGFLSACVAHQPQLALVLDPRLVGLVSRRFPAITVLPRTEQAAVPADVVAAVPLGSLPGVLSRRQRPVPVPFEAWLGAQRPEQSVVALGPCRLGLFWRSFQRQRGPIKSLQLADLAPLATIVGLELQSLQYGDASEALAAFAAATGVTIQPPDFDPFEDIEALVAAISACAGVVTIPSVVAHLCGALGVPCLVLSVSSLARPWYWEGEGDRCPWYPSVQVWRCTSRAQLPQRLAQLPLWASALVPRPDPLD